MIDANYIVLESDDGQLLSLTADTGICDLLTTQGGSVLLLK